MKNITDPMEGVADRKRKKKAPR